MRTGFKGHQWRIFHTAERERGLELCGWGPVQRDKARVDAMVQKLIAKGEAPRAATMMLFTQRFKQAVQVKRTFSRTFFSHDHSLDPVESLQRGSFRQSEPGGDGSDWLRWFGGEGSLDCAFGPRARLA